MNKLIGFILMGLIAFGLCFGFSKIFTGSYEHKAEPYEESYYNMKSKYETLTNTDDLNGVASGQSVGIDLDRFKRDDELMINFFKSSVFGWTNYDGYLVYRDNISKKYGVNDSPDGGIESSSNFLNTFLPLPKIHKDTNDTVVWNEIDANSITYDIKSLSSSVISTDGSNNFTYLSEIVYTKTYKKGKKTKTKNKGAVAIYTIDKIGNISNLNGYVNVK